MPIHPEIQRRAKHAERLMRAGLPRLWAVVVALLALVGGNVLIAFTWGVRHLIWGVIVALVIIVMVTLEGSYRASRDAAQVPESQDLLRLRKLAVEGQAIRARLPTADRRGLVRLPADLTSSYEAWKVKAAAALEPWPDCLAQFQGDTVHGLSLLEPDRKCTEIEQRTKVLDQITRALEQRNGAR